MNISFLKNLSGSHKAALIGIMIVAVVHSVWQLNFIRNENLRSAELTAQTENAKLEEISVERERPETQTIEIRPEEYEVRKAQVADIPADKTTSRRQVETVSPPAKKKVFRETKEARLRRAERILTGV